MQKKKLCPLNQYTLCREELCGFYSTIFHECGVVAIAKAINEKK